MDLASLLQRRASFPAFSLSLRPVGLGTGVLSVLRCVISLTRGSSEHFLPSLGPVFVWGTTGLAALSSGGLVFSILMDFRDG